LATSESYKDASGEWVEKTEWHNVVAWGNLAEQCQKYLTKGDNVYVEGANQTTSYEDKSGVKKYKTEVVARLAFSLEKKASSGSGEASGSGASRKAGSRDAGGYPDEEPSPAPKASRQDNYTFDPDDSLPF
jgi:single-strand DNA-binding protein